jgi:hypothetical protein
MVPNNASTILQNDIAHAEADGSNFESASVPSLNLVIVNLVITEGVPS